MAVQETSGTHPLGQYRNIFHHDMHYLSRRRQGRGMSRVSREYALTTRVYKEWDAARL